MKNILLTLSVTAAIACLNPVNAQYLSVGAKGGVGLNTFSEFPVNDLLIGYNAGFFAWYSTQGALAFGGDILYNRTGGEYYRVSEGVYRRYETALNYVVISPKVAVFLRDYDKRLRPKFTLGPSLGLLLDAEEVNRNIDMGSEFETLNIGLVLGTGINYEVVHAIWVNADVDYNYGFNNVSSINNVSPDRLSNQGLSLSLGISLGIGDVEEE